jgi:probable HAF family extracellular repeat protein
MGTTRFGASRGSTSEESNMSTRTYNLILVTKLLAPLAQSLLVFTAATAVMLTVTSPAAANPLRYKLVVLGTLGGPQSYGDPGDGAAISNRGIAVGAADTATPDPNYPLFNPLLVMVPTPYVRHVFVTKDGPLVDLGSLPGANSAAASVITENGLVSGESLTGEIDPLMAFPAENAVLWKDGKIINLGTLGGYESGAGQVNSRGQVVGFSSNTTADPCPSLFGIGTQTRAFLWENGKMKDLGTLGGPDAAAVFINEQGQAAGLSYTNSITHASTGVCTTDPFLWDKGKMIDLGTLGGTFGSTGETVSLNSRGQVVGLSNLAGDLVFHAFLWPGEDGKMRDLGTFGGDNSEANEINDAGEIIGWAWTVDSVQHAFFWKNGQMTDIGTLDGDCSSNAFGINNRGQVVGLSVTCDGSSDRAFLWEEGQIIDLNVFVPPGTDLTLADVERINERGEILGIGNLSNGDARAFLLIPVGNDDPAGITASSKKAMKSSAESVPTSASAIAAARAKLSRRRSWWGLGTHLGAPLSAK